MIYCKKCGRPNEDHYRFCLGCGARLEHQKPSASLRTSPEIPAERQESKASPDLDRSISLAALSRATHSDNDLSARDASAAKEHRPCPQCGHLVEAGNLFCGQCGTSMPVESGHTAMHTPVTALAELVLIQPDGSPGLRVPLQEGGQTLGRNDAPFSNDPFISPIHASFEVHQDGGVKVEDLGSLNGVYLRLTKPTTLTHGDLFRVGLELLRYEEQSALPALAEEPADGVRVLGSPTKPFWGRLARVAAPNITSHAYLLDQTQINIGRDVGDILFNHDAFVSGQHASLKHTPDGCVLKDLGSSNGTFIKLSGPQHLEHGDTLLLGQQLVMLQVHAN